MAPQPKWTAEYDAQLSALWPMNSAAEIMKTIPFARGTICVRARKLGLKKSPDFTWRAGPLTPEGRKRLIEGARYGQVRRWARARGEHVPEKPPKPKLKRGPKPKRIAKPANTTWLVRRGNEVIA